MVLDTTLSQLSALVTNRGLSEPTMIFYNKFVDILSNILPISTQELFQDGRKVETIIILSFVELRFYFKINIALIIKILLILDKTFP